MFSGGVAAGGGGGAAAAAAARVPTHAIFFDNDAAQCASVQAVAVPGRMQVVHVGGSPDRVPFLRRPFVPGETNAYRVMMSRLVAIYGPGAMDDRYDPSSGIKAEHIALADGWLASLDHQRTVDPSVFVKGIACFDWDRTITIMEGINIRDTERLVRNVMAQDRPNRAEIASRLIHDTFSWHMGGEPRMAVLRALMGRLHAGGVDVYIVSSNSLAADYIFQEMVQTQIFPMCALKFICTRGAPYGKGPVLMAHPAFHQVTQASDASTAASLMAMGRDPAAAAAVAAMTPPVAATMVPEHEEDAERPNRPLAAPDVAGAVDALMGLMTREPMGARRTNRNRRMTRKRRGTSRKSRRARRQ